MTIDKEVFITEFAELADWFKKEFTDKQRSRFYLILSDELDTQQFKQAIIGAYRNCKFFPTPKELIDLALGTLESRAMHEWMNQSKLSAVGKQALSFIGGKWHVEHSEKPDLDRHNFLKAYENIGSKAKPKDFVWVDPAIKFQQKIEAQQNAETVRMLNHG